MPQELSMTSPLLDKHGHLVQVGWARQPRIDCNLEDDGFYKLRPFESFRYKRWDYYGPTPPDFFFSANLAHLGYAGLDLAYTLDFAAGDLHGFARWTARNGSPDAIYC